MRPGPSSTDNGSCVRSTGSPTVTPAARMGQLQVSFLQICTHTRLLVHLNCGFICFYSDDLPHKRIVTNTNLEGSWLACHDCQTIPQILYQLVHGNPYHILRHNNRTNRFSMHQCGIVGTRTLTRKIPCLKWSNQHVHSLQLERPTGLTIELFLALPALFSVILLNSEGGVSGDLPRHWDRVYSRVPCSGQ